MDNGRRDSFDSDQDHDDPDPAREFDLCSMISRRCARRLERCCCTGVTYFPLAFVYGLATWSTWVVCQLGGSGSVHNHGSGEDQSSSWVGGGSSVGIVVLYVMLVWSYTTAVFTRPGSTTDDQGYSTLPTTLPTTTTTTVPVTVKANGEMRFCKKCQARKPDRAHHCSTCRRCILKMDHHCPWLATCIGLHNAKAFLLFLVYTSLFGLLCFATTATWVWVEVVDNATYTSYDESLMPIQYIMLCVLSGIIGLVVGLFTGWHIWLACHGQTTIECMEKTRYRTALRHKSVARDEEMGLPEPDSPDTPHFHDAADRRFPSTQHQLGRRLTYNQLERYRAHKRHQEYLDDQDSQHLPHAFDLGVRRNLLHLLGPSPWLWALPVCNTSGDGWAWEPSPRWLAVRDRLQRARDEQRARERAAGWGSPDGDTTDDDAGPPIITTTVAPPPSAPPARYHRSAPAPRAAFSTSKADRVLGRDPRMYSDELPGSHGRPAANAFSMQRLNAAGRALPREDLQGLEDVDSDGDDADADDDDDDDDADEKQPLQKRPPPLQPVVPSDTSRRQMSPLRARWLPEPTTGASGLLRRVGSVATSASPMGSPGFSSGATSPRESTASPSRDTDDGGVD